MMRPGRLMEAGLVWAGTVLTLAVARRSGPGAWAGLVILAAAALVPNLVAGRALPLICTRAKVWSDFRLAVLTAILVLPLAWAGAAVLARLGWAEPVVLRPSPLAWVLYYCGLAALAEEMFFRGYLQSLLSADPHVRPRPPRATAIVGSSLLFALAHVILHGHIAGALTLLPGLVMGWLYAKTGRLLAPVAFHGLANLCWTLACSA